jgi:hypothetical protein
VGAFVDVVQHAEDELVLLVEAEGGGGEEEVADISSPLAGIGVEGEERVQLSDAIGGEDGVLGADVLGEDGLKLLLLDFLSAHSGSISNNKI